ncbi:MAG: methionine adenosyltransferase [Ignavibacteria bacterium]|nr:MAG: methionine adenosyltransferase [Ignavibacteria bacterium]
MSYLFTSESVSEGHPDKVCDQISDAVLDSILRDDPEARVACECFTTTGFVLVGGEITTDAYVDVQEVVRETVRGIGYTDPKYRFDADSCGVASHIHQQSPDIFRGVKTGGAGDQGIMFGYATSATPEYMPMPILYSHKLVQRLADLRKRYPTVMPYLRPDAKSQVTFEYEGRSAKRVHTIVVSTQHDPGVSMKKIKEDVIEHVISDVFPKELLADRFKLHVNPTGKFEIGGPHGDSGLTGRKIIVDTYGGWAPHGGGAFSGKDPSKVDRSAAYATRHLAKNLVAAGVADECTIQIGYAIGVAKPVSVHVDTHGTAKNGVTDTDIERYIQKNVDMTPNGIIERLKLRRPIYKPTAAYGHFGRNEKDFTWEKLDLVKDIKKNLK